MAKEHADYLTDEEIKKMIDAIDFSKPDEDELERDAYFNDPANAEEIAAMFARMDMISVMYKARQEAGLTQKKKLPREWERNKPISPHWSGEERTSPLQHW